MLEVNLASIAKML